MNEKLTIQHIVDQMVAKHDMTPQEAEEFIKAFFALIEEGLEQDRYVKIKGLGTFKLIDVGSRESVNINNGERIEIQGHTKISFTPEPALKERINRPFSCFETVVLNENTVLEDTPVENGNEESNDDPETVQTEETHLIPQPTATEKTPVKEEKEEKDLPTPTVLQEEPEKEELPLPSKDNGMKYFITLVVFIILMCGGAVLFIYYPDWFYRPTPDSPLPTLPQPDSLLAKDTVAPSQDTLFYAQQPDTSVLQEAKTEITQPESVAPTQEQQVSEIKPKNQSFTADSMNYQIVGTDTVYTIQEGETLTKVALKFYGTKKLWPYLVKHNPKVIKNPNNVPYGTTLRIPKLIKKNP